MIGLDDFGFARHLFDPDVVRVVERRATGARGNIIPVHLVLLHFDFVTHRDIEALDQIFDGHPFLHAVTAAVKSPLTPPAQVQHRFAQRLARYRASMYTSAADEEVLLDE